MGCEYHELKAPWTSLRIDINGYHAQLALWCNGASVGSLTVRQEELNDILHSLKEPYPVAKVSSLDEGIHIAIYGTPRSKQVISENGEVKYWDVLQSKYPVSPTVELDKLIQWARNYVQHTGAFATGHTFFIVEDVGRALRDAEKSLLETKVTPMKASIERLRKLKETADKDLIEATSS